MNDEKENSMSSFYYKHEDVKIKDIHFHNIEMIESYSKIAPFSYLCKGWASRGDQLKSFSLYIDNIARFDTEDVRHHLYKSVDISMKGVLNEI